MIVLLDSRHYVFGDYRLEVLGVMERPVEMDKWGNK